MPRLIPLLLGLFLFHGATVRADVVGEQSRRYALTLRARADGTLELLELVPE